MCRILALIIFIGILMAPSGQTQSQTGSKPSFEVVSIKEAENCGNVAPGVKLKIPGGTSYQSGGRYTTCNLLGGIISEAYKIEAFASLTGAPDWSKDILYKIEAKAEGDPDKEQMHRMVQSLLEERFKLRMHHETEEGPVYLLVVGKGGHKLQTSKNEPSNSSASTPTSEERQKIMNQIARSSFSPESISALPPGTITMIGTLKETRLIARAISMEGLAKILYSDVGRRRVIDKTGLTGLYDIQISYARSGPPSAADPASSTEPTAPTIFKALQDQLGLKLESDKAQLDRYVIDSVEKPTEN